MTHFTRQSLRLAVAAAIVLCSYPAFAQVARGTKAVRPRVRATAEAGLFGGSLRADQLGRITVVEVAPNSQASAAGIQVGDRILSIEGYAPATMSQLMDYTSKLIPTKQAGDRIAVKLSRNEKEHTVLVLIGENTTTAVPSPGQTAPAAGGSQTAVLGVAVKERGPHLVVTQVVPNQPAFKAGIRPNDVIVAVGKQPITSYASLAAAIAPYKVGDRVPVEIVRGQEGGIMSVIVGQGTAGTADVMLDASDDVSEIVAEVKRLRTQVDQLSQSVQVLSREVQLLKAGRR